MENKMLNENFISDKQENQNGIELFRTLFFTLLSLKKNDNVDDAYINFNAGELEIYIFIFEDDIETEDFIIKSITDWEGEQKCFPEIYIRQSDEKMLVLPREVMKICL